MKRMTQKLIKPLEKFFHLEISGGIVLLFMSVVAIFLRNSSVGETFEHFLHWPLVLEYDFFVLKFTLHQFVNDALMVIFFFVVGLEIKRELVEGELSNVKNASFPIFAALGGMIVPALIYTAFNFGTNSQNGWGIPMATDIAFAVGVLSLVIKRVPFSAKVFLLALAIVDDLGAILVIALFYTEAIASQALGGAIVIFLFMFILRKLGVSNKFVYFLLALVSWAFFAKSGVHSTIAGVIFGLMTPVRYINLKGEVSQPLEFWIKNLHPWVSFFIMPVFALFNASVFLGDFSLKIMVDSHLFWGIFLGLILGKPLGVFLLTFLAEALGLSKKPESLSWIHVLGIGILSGIGFTMSIFISHLGLAFEMQNEAKISILLASLVAAVSGVILFVLNVRKSSL